MAVLQAGDGRGTAENRAELERDLWDALRDGSFVLAYQPQYELALYELASGTAGVDRLCGFEALLR